MNSNSGDQEDAGPPLPDFRTSNIQLQTVAPALGVTGGSNTPDYIDYDPKARGFNTVFANAGVAYLMGITGGGLYGLRQGIQSAPSSHFRVRFNSILNHSGRYGSRAGNTLGVFAVLYSLYEVIADQYDLEERIGARAISPALGSFVAPALGAVGAGVTYYAPSGFRAAGLAGAIGMGSVSATFALYSAVGIPYGRGGFLFF